MLDFHGDLRIAAILILGLIGLIVILGAAVSDSASSPAAGKSPATRPAGEFTIEKFEFSWIVAEDGKFAQVRVDKDQKDTCIVLRDDQMNFLKLTPRNAQAIGTAFHESSELLAKIVASPTLAEETINANGFTVIFRHHPKEGFSVIVQPPPPEAGAFDTLRLTTGQIAIFAPHLLQAQKLVDFVDSKIQP